jgi:adenine-specific DNA methylase
MKLSTTEKKPNTDISWEAKKIGKWRDNISYATLEKLQAEYANTDTIIRTNDSFSSELYASGLKEKSLECTIKGMREIIEEDVIKPLGTEFTFTKISHNAETIFLNRDPFKQIHKEGTVSSLFNHGILRDPFLYAFSKEKRLINGSEPANQPEFIFRTNTLVEDIFECEHLKHVFTNLKKDNGT